MIKIGVIGYSGKVNNVIINEIINSPKFELSGVLVRSAPAQPQDFPLYYDVKELARASDAIIDFSSLDTSLRIIEDLVSCNALLVCGTTGFTDDDLSKIKVCSRYYPIILSANMSIGINLILSMLNKISVTLGDDFDAGIIDIHRKGKKDSPSGTAKLMAKEIVGEVDIASLRLGEEKGEHSIIFSNSQESLTINHRTIDRRAYAKGALKACEWGIRKHKGLYNMRDVFADAFSL